MTRKHSPESVINGFVLVGGASSRMNRDKAQIKFGNLRLFEIAALALRPVCREPIALVGTGAEQLTVSSKIDFNPIDDDRTALITDDLRAPLIGVYTSLINSEADWAVVLACDLPFVPAFLISELAARISDEVDAVVPLQNDGRPQPLCAIYNVDRCFPVIETMLASGELRMRDLLSRVRVTYIEFVEVKQFAGNVDPFLNLNRPEDLKIAEAKLPAAS